jgi:hypothetical protein
VLTCPGCCCCCRGWATGARSGRSSVHHPHCPWEVIIIIIIIIITIIIIIIVIIHPTHTTAHNPSSLSLALVRHVPPLLSSALRSYPRPTEPACNPNNGCPLQPPSVDPPSPSRPRPCPPLLPLPSLTLPTCHRVCGPYPGHCDPPGCCPSGPAHPGPGPGHVEATENANDCQPHTGQVSGVKQCKPSRRSTVTG